MILSKDGREEDYLSSNKHERTIKDEETDDATVSRVGVAGVSLTLSPVSSQCDFSSMFVFERLYLDQKNDARVR